MGEIAKNIIYNNFIKKNGNITSEGITINGIQYFSVHSDEDFYVSHNYFPSEDFIRKNIIDIAHDYIPKLSTDLFQEFIAKELKTALLVTRNLTPLFNTSLMYDKSTSYTSNTLYLDKKDLKEILLPLFNIDETKTTGYNRPYHYLSFKEEILKE